MKRHRLATLITTAVVALTGLAAPSVGVAAVTHHARHAVKHHHRMTVRAHIALM